MDDAILRNLRKNEENQGKVVVFMDIVAFIEEYFGIQLLTYQKITIENVDDGVCQI